MRREVFDPKVQASGVWCTGRHLLRQCDDFVANVRNIRDVSPDRVKKSKSQTRHGQSPVRVEPSPEDAHAIVYFRRHLDDDSEQSIPAREFIRACPNSVRAKLSAVLVAVASAPPRRFSGGGYWEAMKGDMTGWFEVRADGPRRHHYRLYCRLDYEAIAVEKPLLVVIAGLDKPFRTKLNPGDYSEVKALGEEYLARNPRSLA